MRRWMEMWSDPSQTIWTYNRGQQAIPDQAAPTWVGMPSKQQFSLYHNYAAQIYVKAGVYSPGANPPAECGSGEFIPNPDQDYNIFQPFVRYDTFLFAAIYPTINLTLFEFTTTKPLGDWIDPTVPTVHRRRTRRRS